MSNRKGAHDRQADTFEEIPVTNPDPDFPERNTGTASATRTISVAEALASADGSTIQPGPAANTKTLVDEDSGTENVFYVGKAVLGTATSVSEWQMKRITITEIANKTSVDIEWADGDDYFDNIYDNREALSFS